MSKKVEKKIETPEAEQKPKSYFDARMDLLGITAAMNRVKVWQTGTEMVAAGIGKTRETILVDVPVFKESPQGIKIYITTLDRQQISFVKEGSRWANDKYHITRLTIPRVKANGDIMKYDIPKGQGTYPFFHPALIKKYEEQTEIESLFITEGFFKAFKGCMHGLDVVGVSSITHLKEKETGKMHADILKLIQACRVKRVVWLTDGDCLDISHKEITSKTDLYKRPKSFFASATNFQQLFSDFDIEKWFAHIDSEALLFQDISQEKPKGLDDMLIAMAGKEEVVVADLNSFGKTSARYNYCHKADITFGPHKLLKYFNLDNVNNFYLWHIERRQDLRGKEFLWNGTLYKWDDEKNECKILVPGEAENYFRVGDQYHEFVEIPNKHQQLERTFHRRQKGTIIDDHGKGIIEFVPKYKAFCNVPDHTNFQQVIHSNFNLYGPMEWTPEEADCTPDDFPTIIKFIRHIFGTGTGECKLEFNGKKVTFDYTELGLDYIQLLYQRPTQILPILCLVSKENNTGKSTLGKFLKILFTSNCTILGNAELAENFNAIWASKLLIICDEAKIDKLVVVEKVKAMSTADKVLMRMMQKDHVEIDFFGKFMFITNHEENFLPATEDDVRYWVIKVPVIKELQTDMLKHMKDEIPAFLSYLGKRKMHTDDQHRAWFDPALIRTDALKRVIAYSAPTIEKELRQFFREKFFDFGLTEIYMTLQEIHVDCFNRRYERNYLEKVLKERLNLDVYFEYEYDGKDFGTLKEAQDHAESKGLARDVATLQAKKIYKVHRYSYPRWNEVKHDSGDTSERKRFDVKGTGRHYVIPVSKFLTPEELANFRPDPEQKFISDNVTNAEVPAKAKVGDDDLPF